MKRIYACIVIVAALLCVSFYSSFQVQKFADAVSDDLDTAVAVAISRRRGGHFLTGPTCATPCARR